VKGGPKNCEMKKELTAGPENEPKHRQLLTYEWDTKRGKTSLAVRCRREAYNFAADLTNSRVEELGFPGAENHATRADGVSLAVETPEHPNTPVTRIPAPSSRRVISVSV
jgi:hypothetical protein